MQPTTKHSVDAISFSPHHIQSGSLCHHIQPTTSYPVHTITSCSFKIYFNIIPLTSFTITVKCLSSSSPSWCQNLFTS